MSIGNSHGIDESVREERENIILEVEGHENGQKPILVMKSPLASDINQYYRIDRDNNWEASTIIFSNKDILHFFNEVILHPDTVHTIPMNKMSLEIHMLGTGILNDYPDIEMKNEFIEPLFETKAFYQVHMNPMYIKPMVASILFDAHDNFMLVESQVNNEEKKISMIQKHIPSSYRQVTSSVFESLVLTIYERYGELVSGSENNGDILSKIKPYYTDFIVDVIHREEASEYVMMYIPMYYDGNLYDDRKKLSNIDDTHKTTIMNRDTLLDNLHSVEPWTADVIYRSFGIYIDDTGQIQTTKRFKNLYSVDRKKAWTKNKFPSNIFGIFNKS